MDAERFDFLTRKLGSGSTRRQALAALAAVPALWTQRGRAAQLGPPPCGSAGKVCTMLAGCCDGLTCVTSAINTNYGVCVSGGDGGTVASGTSLVSPYSESAQISGTVDSPSTSTTPSTTTGTTTSTTDPKAERQAKLQERRSRRSTRRNKIQSRRTTKSTSRKTRREDAAEAAVLAAGPVLELSFSNRIATNGEDIDQPYEELLVRNVSDLTAIINEVGLLDGSDSTGSLKYSLSSGAAIGFVSGRPNDAKVDSGQFWWRSTDVCVGDPDKTGWIVKAAFSGEFENREYEVLCSREVSGEPLTSDEGTTNNRRKRKKKHQQQAAARRKKNKQNNKKGR